MLFSAALPLVVAAVSVVPSVLAVTVPSDSYSTALHRSQIDQVSARDVEGLYGRARHSSHYGPYVIPQAVIPQAVIPQAVIPQAVIPHAVIPPVIPHVVPPRVPSGPKIHQPKPVKAASKPAWLRSNHQSRELLIRELVGELMQREYDDLWARMDEVDGLD
ncbi:uncharacterized protein C8Q71DRAFT_857402 [Rhodofomes roseus]|uniref:Uncharacterized protein n=1 Tax=Rhodofomes roseus TaxID=34475 RepID=A0ABQ8KGU3_9APHY|nr:uncharacterized protein C8Q71DRAFT_857402 [Rhodofomes roseus]KAH9837080.1 hypothetical protein C8Q71DRAFT_857402 [Rhodofomes roseus]